MTFFAGRRQCSSVTTLKILHTDDLNDNVITIPQQFFFEKLKKVFKM